MQSNDNLAIRIQHIFILSHLLKNLTTRQIYKIGKTQQPVTF